MGRLRSLATLFAGALAAAPAPAAEITRVSSSGEPDSAFDLRIDLRYERTQRRAKISREYGDVRASATGTVSDNLELNWSQLTSRVVPALHVGLWHDLEFRAELPYVLGDDTSWRDASAGITAISAVPTAGYYGMNADGAACTSAAPCPFFPVDRTLYGGGAFDDLKIGLAWGILSDRKDAYAPTWVVSLDLTIPTATRFDPAAGRLGAASFFDAPSFASSKRAGVGRKIWVYELATALSRRIGSVDPYLQAHLRIPQKSSSTYSNCVHAKELADPALGQMTTAAPSLCQTAARKMTEADPPLVAGMIFGAELVPYEDRTTGQKFSIDLRLGADVTSSSRWYNELTPATGKLLHSEAFLTGTAQVGLNLRASRYVTLGAQGTFQTDTAHLITGEAPGRVSNEVVNPPTNPNFDFRWDLPGRRFRVYETSVLAVAVTAALTF
jgi:hypothetical protein